MIKGPVVTPVRCVIAFDSLHVFHNLVHILRTESLSCDFNPFSVYWLCTDHIFVVISL